MANIISIKDLTFGYKDKELFTKFELTVAKGEWLSIVGPNASGKSTLVRLLVGLLTDGGFIQIDGLILTKSTIKEIRRKVGVVFSNPDNTFVAETVMDELAFPLENLRYTKTKIRKKITEVAKKIGLEKILKEEPHRLSGGEKQLVAIGTALMHDPKILIIDEGLSMLDRNAREKVLKVLKKLRREEKLTIITVTHDLEETLYSDRLLLIKDGKKIIEGNTLDVLNNEKMIYRLGLDIPFMVDLSQKLKFYGLLDETYLSMKEMVNKLWK